MKKFESSLSLSRLAFVWLVSVFLLCLGLRFTTPRPASTVEESLRLPERLALVANFSPELSPWLRQQLLASAKRLEAKPDRLRVLERQPVPSEIISKLPDGYRLMAQCQAKPEVSQGTEIRQLAEAARQRLLLCLALLGGLVGLALTLSLFGRAENETPVLPMTAWGPGKVLALFMVWDVSNLLLVSSLIGALRLKQLMAPLPFLLVFQMAGYAWLLALLKLARPAGAPWNLRFPCPTAWVGRGYFACYALVMSVNLAIGAIFGQAPTSSNPLIEFFLSASPVGAVALATLVIVIGPCFEELIFRGWLLGGLRQHWGDNAAILVSSALFAAIHADLWASPALFILGCIFAKVYLRSGSLYASIALHAMWNATTFTFLLANMP